MSLIHVFLLYLICSSKSGDSSMLLRTSSILTLSRPSDFVLNPCHVSISLNPCTTLTSTLPKPLQFLTFKEPFKMLRQQIFLRNDVFNPRASSLLYLLQHKDSWIILRTSSLVTLFSKGIFKIQQHNSSNALFLFRKGTFSTHKYPRIQLFSQIQINVDLSEELLFLIENCLQFCSPSIFISPIRCYYCLLTR